MRARRMPWARRTTCSPSTTNGAWRAAPAPPCAPPRRSSRSPRSTRTWPPRWPTPWWPRAAALFSRAPASPRSARGTPRSSRKCRAWRAWRRACCWNWRPAAWRISCWWTAPAPPASSVRACRASTPRWPRRTSCWPPRVRPSAWSAPRRSRTTCCWRTRAACWAPRAAVSSRRPRARRWMRPGRRWRLPSRRPAWRTCRRCATGCACPMRARCPSSIPCGACMCWMPWTAWDRRWRPR